MSGTRSLSLKERAISNEPNHTAFLISHGQPSDPDVAEAELRVLRNAVAPLLPGWRVVSATLASSRALETALFTATHAPLVFPLFMTDGWFTQTALPKRLEGMQARLLRPLGVDPGLPPLAARWLGDQLRKQGWSAADTTLIVAAHGSGRSRNSSRDTHAFADAVQTLAGFSEVRVGFIEEPPVLVDVLADAGKQAICLPFFAARRGHVLDDLPAALEETGFAGLQLDPIGLHPAIPQLIADAFISASAPKVLA